MDATTRPRRSALYVPGANERAIEKAKVLSADVMIFDLEDAVAPDIKIAARERVCAAVASRLYGRREIAIRVNGLGTPWHVGDVQAVNAVCPDAIVVPKINSAADVQAIERNLQTAGADGSLHIWVMLETPRAVLQAVEIAHASPRLTVLVMGTNDLVNEMRAEHVPGRAPLWFALGTCLLAARSAKKAILDGVYDEIQDPAGFQSECTQARQMGFDGKTLIHPSQLEPCNRIFSPSAAEVELARQVIAAFERAQAKGQGVAVVEGRMIECVHIEAARRTLAITEGVPNGPDESLRLGPWVRAPSLDDFSSTELQVKSEVVAT